MIRKIINNKYFYGLLILFPGFLLLILSGNKFAYPAESQYSDIAITHYPNILYLKNAILNEHVLPLWSNTILSGYPFAANPLSGIWYLPTYICVQLPLPFGINLLVALHITFSIFGLFHYLKEEGYEPLISIIGALSWGLFSKLFAHFALGHITLLFSISWTPWLLFFELKSFKFPDKRKYFFITSIIYGAIILADPRWAAYSGLLWLFFSFWQYNKTQRENLDKGAFPEGFVLNMLNWGGRFISRVVLSILLAAPLIVPLTQYTLLSTRASLSISDSTTLSLPVKYLLGVIIPNMGGYGEWVLYSGGLFALCLIYYLINIKRIRDSFFWLSLFTVSLILSLGSNIPYIGQIFKIPVFSLLRVPSRFLFLSGFAASIIVVGVLNSIKVHKKTDKKYLLISAAVAILPLFLTLCLKILYNVLSIELLWCSLSLMYFAIVFWLYFYGKIKTQILFMLMIAGTIVDFGGVDLSQINYKNTDTVLNEAKEVLDFLATDKEFYRVYSPSYSIPQQVAATKGLELADGIDPLQYLDYVEFMEQATGVPYEQYGVTIPPYETGNPGIDNKGSIPDADLLGLLNVKYVVSDFKIHTQDLILVDDALYPYVYINNIVKPRAWIQEVNRTLGEGIIEVPGIREYSNRIEITTQHGGLLVLSEVNYPGWKVYIDNKQAEMRDKNALLRIVKIPDGEHKVEFIFTPDYLYICIIISVITLIFSLIMIIKKGKITKI